MEVKLTDNSQEVIKLFEKATDAALEKIGLSAEGYAKREITKQKAVDTGRLRNSISHDTDGKDVYIGSNVEYAPYVEMGTKKMAARPYLKPAVTEHTATYKKLVENEYKNG